MNIKIFMIRIKEHPVSEMYLNLVKSSWKDHKLKFFEAITPKDLYLKNQLTFATKHDAKHKRREFSSTEKAVWYSHFELWCKCVREGSLLVLEHDSKLVKPLPDLSEEGYNFLSFINRDFGKKGVDISPGSGYYITPPVAERLVARAVSKPIATNSDGHLSVVMNIKKQRKMNDYHYIEQVNIDGLNTIEHYNPNRIFVGLDYEDIDLSSVHR